MELNCSMQMKCSRLRGGKTLNKYEVKISPRAALDIDNIYCHIADEFKNIGAAEKHASMLEEAILGLDMFPYRGAERKTGAFANKGYRQLFVKNYTVVYRIDEDRKLVIIVTVRYTPSSF